MRKLLVLLIIGAVSLTTFAQKGKVTSASNYLTNGKIDKAWETIQLAEQSPKSVNYYKTYFVKAKILQVIGESEDDAVKALVEDPLPKAYEAYKKSVELDDKGKVQKSIDLQYPMLNNDFINLGVTHFTAEEYPEAVEAFETALEIQKSPVFGGTIDTIIIYNTALAAYNGKDWKKAAEYFNQCAELRYGSTGVYQLLNRTYISEGDSLAAENVLKDGIVAYPDEDVILLELIQYYLNTSRDEDALSYLTIAKKQAPDNKVLWYVEGILYDKQKDVDKAVVSYEKAIELDPEYFDPYYNIGVIKFNEGVRLQDVANQISDNKKYEVAKQNMDDAFAAAVPYFEKAAEINPDSRESLENLKILYYRLQELEKREEVVKKLDELDSE